ncbi:MAG TPA: translocation/assembly module TamB domain-containing protein [Puia sp.]|nr:translocation/assembly module TamB domain-containing protein [Puia sp.]
MIHRLARVFLKILLTILIILILVIFLIQTPYVQNIIRGKAETYLSRKLKTRITIGKIFIKFPESIEIRNIYVEDRQKDTLLSAGTILVDIHMWGLLHNNIDIGKLQLSDLTVKVKRQLPDTAFNFQFIADAFAGAPDTTTKKSSSPMKMALRKIMLEKIRMVYKDVVTGNDVEVWIDNSETKMDSFDPTALHFSVSDFYMKGLRARIFQTQPLTAASPSSTPAAPDTAASSFQLKLGKIKVENSALDYRNTVNAFYTNLQLGRLAANMKSFDLNNRIIDIDKVSLDSTTTVIHMGKLAPPSGTRAIASARNVSAGSGTTASAKPTTRGKGTPPPAPADTSSGWSFAAASLELNGNNFQYDDDNQRRQKSGMDYGHLKITQLTLHAGKLHYNKDAISGALTKGQFKEQSGFQLDQLQTSFLYTDKKMVLKDLLVRTPGTLLQRNAAISYPSLAAMMKDPAHTLLDVDLADSRVQVKDILTFVPSLATQPAFAHPADTWSINARLKGSLASLRVETLQFSGIQDFKIDLSGTIAYPADPKRIAANLDIKNISGSQKGLIALLPKDVLPANIAIPAHYSLKGKINGGMQDLIPDLVLNTSSGNVIVKGTIRSYKDPAGATYDLALQTKALDLGYILKDSLQWGPVTANFTAKGRGLDLPHANATLNGHITSALIKKYNYRDLQFDGSIADRQFQMQATIDNEAVHFDLRATGDLKNKFPALQLDWQIDTLDLHALHLIKDTLQFKGIIHGDFASTNPDSLDGSLKLSRLIVVQGTQRLATDSMQLLAKRIGDQQDLQFHSEMADLELLGKYKLTEVPQALEQTINKYYRLNGFRDTAFTAQDWRMQLHVRMSPLALTLMPSLKGTDSIYAQMAFNSDRKDLRMTIDAPKVQFGSQVLQKVTFQTSTGAFTPITGFASASAPAPADSAALRDSAMAPASRDSAALRDSSTALASRGSVPHSDSSAAARNVAAVSRDSASAPADSSSGRQLKYRLDIAGITGSGLTLHQTSLRGYLADNKLFTGLLVKDEKGKDYYRLAGQLDKLSDGLKFILNPDSLLLNHDQWQVSRDNYFLYDSAGIVVNNFSISNKGESLQVKSNPPAPTSPIDVSFTDFKLSTLSRFANQDSLLIDGTLNGKAEVKNILSNPVFTSDLQIKGLNYKKDSVGDLTIKVNNEKANAFAADISLQGNQNDVNVKGEYFTGEGRMDMKLDLRQLNLASVRSFASTQVQAMKGFLKGSLAITGTMDQPTINGNLHFDSAMITPVITGEPLKVSNDNIEFDKDGFNFSEFSFRDSANNKATLDGNVYTSNYRDYKVDVTFNAQNFRLVNAPQTGNQLFYGKLNMDAAVSLTGNPVDDLKADGGIRVNKKTDFVFVLPESNPEIVDRQGVVRFIDRNMPGDTLVDHRAKALAAKQSAIKGMDIGINIETDSNAIFTMVIDERNGDALQVRGRSNLAFGMDKSGKTDLTGAFEIESGSYNLSLSVLKRKFNIQHGSTITWTGDMTTATLDLTATYAANTPSIDLIANEISDRSPTEINKFKQKLPFLVTLKMEGELLKPVITFDITLPQELLSLWPDVDQKLQQIRNDQSELDKQVFALLLLNRFVGENPLQSEAGGGSSVGNLAFQSASQILTNQLNQLAASLIKGVDINFDLNNQQDFSTGTEQDYTELNVSVSKRLFNDRITVNVGSNFDVQGTGNANQNASNIAGDVAVDYRLTKDGRYMVRAYRKNQYEAVIEGQVVETGVSFILTLDYNKFREIFGRTREERLEERRRVKAATKTPKTDQP